MGANPYVSKNPMGKKLGNVLGAVCLLVFIVFDELWIGTLSFALGFAVIWGVQVFQEKSHKWYTSPYLYATVISFVLAFAEFKYDFLTDLFKLG